jgi:hypothetical protein
LRPVILFGDSAIGRAKETGEPRTSMERKADDFDEQGIINQGQGNLTARALQVHQDETINKRALLNLFQAIIANNRVGAWRKLKGSQ